MRNMKNSYTNNLNCLKNLGLGRPSVALSVVRFVIHTPTTSSRNSMEKRFHGVEVREVLGERIFDFFKSLGHFPMKRRMRSLIRMGCSPQINMMMQSVMPCHFLSTTVICSHMGKQVFHLEMDQIRCSLSWLVRKRIKPCGMTIGQVLMRIWKKS